MYDTRSFQIQRVLFCVGHEGAQHADFRLKRMEGPILLHHPWKPPWLSSRYARLMGTCGSVSGRTLATGSTGREWTERNTQLDFELRRLCEEGEVGRAVDAFIGGEQQGSVPSVQLYRMVLQACAKKKALAEARRVRAHMAKNGLESNRYLGDCVVETLVKCGSLEGALEVMERLSYRSVFMWTTIISGHCKLGQWRQALEIYGQMQDDGVEPNKYTFVAVLKAAGSLALVKEGKRIHGDILRQRCEADVFVGTSLIDMYAKCGNVADARDVFDNLAQRDGASWNAMLAGYARHNAQEALRVFAIMRNKDVKPNNRTFVSVLQACGYLADNEEGILVDGQVFKVESIQKGKALHAETALEGYGSDVFVVNTLIGMYAKCGSIRDAEFVFDNLLHRNVVSWRVMISAHAQQGQGHKALEIYRQVQEKGIASDFWTTACALRACSGLADTEEGVDLDGEFVKLVSLRKGKEIHADAVDCSYDLVPCVAHTLMTMYAKCGSIMDAQLVFDRLPQRDVVSWNALLSGYSQQKESEKRKRVWELYGQMLNLGFRPNQRTFAILLQACSYSAGIQGIGTPCLKVEALHQGKLLHAQAVLSGFEADVFVNTSLVRMYAKCGSILDAQNVFDTLPSRNVVSWTAMIAGYAQQEEVEEVFKLYSQMQEEDITPNEWTFTTVLQACSVLLENEGGVLVDGNAVKLSSLTKIKALHAAAAFRGHGAEVFVGTTLLNLYVKCGSLGDAEYVFRMMCHRNVPSWNAMLVGYVQHGLGNKALELYDHMQGDNIRPDGWTFASLLQACGSIAEKEEIAEPGLPVKVEALQKGKVLHSEAIQSGYESNVFVSNNLVSLYSKCGSLIDAQLVFNRLSHRDVVSWTAMIVGYVQQDQGEKALELYWQMQEEGVMPDDQTFVTALKACKVLAGKEESTSVDVECVKVDALRSVKAIHFEAAGNGLESPNFLPKALISAYVKCGSISQARYVFDNVCERNVDLWNVMITAYVQLKEGGKALDLYHHMLEESIPPDYDTFVSLFQACGSLAQQEESIFVDGQCIKAEALQIGKAIHAQALCRLSKRDIFYCNVLASFYVKCGSIRDAEDAFTGFEIKDVVSWNVLLAGYAHLSEGDRALKLYAQMQQECVEVDEVTYLCVLKSCCQLGALNICHQIYQDVVDRGLERSPCVATTLIQAFGKCGSMVDARSVFDSLSQENLWSWNSLIAGYASQGQYEMSVQCYEDMRLAGIKPNGVTFCSLLSACSHAGMVDEGLKYFESMVKDHGITATIEHYGSMIDLCGRAGLFRQTEELLLIMPMEPNLNMWLSLLGACRKHGKVDLGRKVFDILVSLEPKHGAGYLLMSNIYAHAGMSDCAMEIQKLRDASGAWIPPGLSWVEHGLERHTFMVGDGRKNQQERILFTFLDTLLPHLELT